MENLELGYDVPARVGMPEADILTPALVLDLDVLEANVRAMGDHLAKTGMMHRAHGKMHKSVDVARLQMTTGGARGVCCQKVSEAEAFVRGGIDNILVSNQIVAPVMIERLVALGKRADVTVCVDNPDNARALSAAAVAGGATLGIYIEVDCGQHRCGVAEPADVVELARLVRDLAGLRYDGLQAYQGAMQHVETHADRKAAFDAAAAKVSAFHAALSEAGLEPPVISGGGTGSYEFETAHPLWTELQCGSYAFMDADYARIRRADGGRFDQSFGHALYLLATVISTQAGRAVGDAGLKATTIECGLPVSPDARVSVETISDEHTHLLDPGGVLSIGDKLRLIPSHCDPTCNLHDWYVGVRGGVVECLWPVSARGKVF